MNTFRSFLGLSPKPFPEVEPQFKAFFQKMAKAHGEEKAAREYERLKATPVGQYQMLRAGAVMTPGADEPSWELGYRAASRTGSDMYRPQ